MNTSLWCCLACRAAREGAAHLKPSLADLHDAFSFKAREFRSADVSAGRAASLVLFFGVLVIALGVATLAWLGSVILLRWEKNGRSLLNNLASIAAIAPPLLLHASLCLYGVYYPYMRHIKQFESGDQLFRELLPFWESLAGPWMYRGFWLNMLIWPTVWCVAIAAAGMTTLRWIATRGESDSLHEEQRRHCPYCTLALSVSVASSIVIPRSVPLPSSFFVEMALSRLSLCPPPFLALVSRFAACYFSDGTSHTCPWEI